ncbi:MAG: DUF3073 domain-containing protein [Actinomycetota bacterium]|nr:DUF3073 domain-containing protein [Actinomycetota bacterium]
MGRGRAKAKQTKVARELKYREFNTDFNQLQRELHGDDQAHPAVDDPGPPAGDSAADDPYADLYGDGTESANQR